MTDAKPLWVRCGVSEDTACDACGLTIGEGIRRCLIAAGKAYHEVCSDREDVRERLQAFAKRAPWLYAIINRSWIGRVERKREKRTGMYAYGMTVDEAVHNAINAFRREFGRLPTDKEIRKGAPYRARHRPDPLQPPPPYDKT